MTEEIQKRDHNEIIVFGKDFELAQRMCKALASSPMTPDNYRDVGSCMIALDMSYRTGMPVLAIMQNMYIVHGKPAFEAKFSISLVNTCGRFSKLRYLNNGKSGDEYGVYAVAKDLQTGEELRGTTITWAMVKSEGWNENKKRKDGSIQKSKWNTMPEQMFIYRAASFWQRQYAPELTMGMRTADEEEDAILISEVEKRPITLDDIADRNNAKVVEVLKEKPKDADPAVDSATLLKQVYEFAERAWGDEWGDRIAVICEENGFRLDKSTDEQKKYLIGKLKSLPPDKVQ
jgi:hypothetical protein